MSDFDGKALIAGSVRGYRHFTPSYGGALYGPATHKRLEPGENVAAHVESPGLFSFTRTFLEGQHQVAMRNCVCGYYAYFKPEFSQYRTTFNTPAIVEAYGRVTFGEKGFKAEKIRLLAITIRPGLNAWYEGTVLSGVRDRFPDVAVFTDEAQMLAEFPPTDPAELPVEPPPPPQEEVKDLAEQIKAFHQAMTTPVSISFPTVATARGGIRYTKILPPMPPPKPARRKFRLPRFRRT